MVDRRMNSTRRISGSDDTLELPADVLSHVFALNADMGQDQAEIPRESVSEWPPRALTIIRDASHVCRSWRNLILFSPTLWGKLIDIDYLSHISDEAAQEILSRAGNALLTVKAQIKIRDKATDNAARSLLSHVLEANWDRIEKLSVHVFKAHRTEPHYWPQFYMPARSLKSFQLYFVSYFTMEHVLPFDGRRLFDGVAPQLRSIDLGNRMEIDPGASWLSHIRYIRIYDAPMPLSRWLDLLSATTMLESLVIHFSSIDQQSPDLENCCFVRLPYLTRLAVSHRLFDVAALLGHLEVPPRCLVDIITTDPERIKSADDIDLVKDVLGTYAKAWITHFSEQPQLCLSVLRRGFCVKQYIQGTEKNPVWCFCLDVSCSSDHDLHSVLPYLDAFAGINFDHISELALEISGSWTLDTEHCVESNPSIPRFISRLQNVECMYTTIKSVDTLIRMTYHHSVLFPVLSRLKLGDIWSIYGRLMGPENAPAKVVRCFLEWRESKGHPIQLLDLTHCDLIPDLSSLDNMATGMKIRWKSYRFASECEPEYICGSGRQDVLANLRPHELVDGTWVLT
ncbi:unnamed protein product [Cyclocybe aegerita]|uniref:F-box domain-containing protein n=1 Tax=Cyclocybe aegerita TaxID=1973307 RepID=A0A8S0WU14_CYCAE|nr:unnamed protein product [Cyclocybe aegerita]